MAFDPDAYLEKTAPKETKAFDPDAYLSQAPAPAEEPPVEKPSMLAGTKLEPELPVQPLSSPVDLESLPKFDASKMPTAEDRAVAAFGITPEMGMGEKTLRTAKSSLKDASNALEQKWLGGARLISDITGLKKEEIKGVSGQFNKEQNAVAKTYESDYGLKMAKNIGSSVISNLPTMGVGLYAGTTAALTNMFGDSFLQTYDDSRNEGLGVGASTVRSTLYGTAEALGESLGLPYLLKGAKDALKGVPTAQLAKDLAHYMVKEIPGEQLTYISQFLTDKGFNMNPEAGLTEFLQGMKDTALVTVGQTAVMGGAGFATNKVLKDLRDHHSKGEDGIPKAADMVKEAGFNFNRPAATPEAPITPEAAAPEAAVPQAVTQQATELPPMVAPTAPESQNKDIMMAELEGRPIPPERPEVPPVVAPAAAAPIPKEQTIGEQTQSQLKDLYKQQGSLLKQKDDLNVFLRKNGINTQDRSDMGIQPSESRNYAGVFRNKAQRLDVLMHSAMEKGIISEADLARFPDAVEGFRQMAKDAIDGNVAQTPQNMANMAQMKSLQDQIDSLESIPKEQYGLKAETAEETQSRIKQEAAARKAQEDAAIQADMDAQAERDRAEIARRSAEQSQNFGLGQTPEESLTGQQRLDDDIPFFSQATAEQEQINKKTADQLKGQVVWQKGDLGLIRGYGEKTGEPMYIFTKNGAYTNYDIAKDDRLTPQRLGITPEQKQEILDVREKLEKEAEQKHAAQPHLTIGKGITGSKNLPKDILNVARGWSKMLGIKHNVHILTKADAEAQKEMFTGPHRVIGFLGTEAEFGNMKKMLDGNYVIVINPSTSKIRTLETLAHEMGHIHEKETFQNADIPTKNAIIKEFNVWYASQEKTSVKELIDSLRPKMTAQQTAITAPMSPSTQLGPYWRKFEEWYSDQVSRWATTSEKPLTVVDKFFAKLAAAMKKFYATVKGQKYLPTQTMQDFLDNIARQSQFDAISDQSDKGQMALFSKSVAAPEKYFTVDEIYKMQRDAYKELSETKEFKESQKRIDDARNAYIDRFNAVKAEAVRLLKENPEFSKLSIALDEKKILERVAMDAFQKQAEENIPLPKVSEGQMIAQQNKIIEVYFKEKGIPEPREFSEFANQQRPYYSDPKFKKWFGNSKVVDKNGQPLVAFHSTDKDFSEFNVGKGTPTRTKNLDYTGQLGSWFTAPSLYDREYEAGNAENAVTFSEGNEGDNMMPVHLSIKKPMEYEGFEDLRDDRDSYKSIAEYKKQLIDDGYDGIVIRNSMTDGNVDRDDWVAFNPTQVKSAIGNKGTFSPESGDITEAKATTAPAKHKNYLGEPAPLSQWDMPTDSKTERFIYRIQDKYIDTKRAIQAIKSQVGEIADKWDAYLKEELYHGRTAKKTQDFLNDEVLPIVKEMQKSNINLPEFDEYLHNRHAEERNIQIAKINPAMPDSGSGIATQDSKDYLAKLDPAKAKSLENMAKQIDKIIQKTQKILVNAGLESQDTIDIWNKTYKKYVPLMREDLDFSQKFGGTGAGFSTKGGSSKRAVGSLKEVADIFANVASQRERAIVRAEKARVGTALYGLAIQNPNPEFWLAVNPDAIKNEAALIKELQAMGLDAQDAKSIIQEPKTPYIDEKTGLVAYRVNPLLRNSDNVFPVRIDGKDRFIFFNPNDERAMRMVSAIKNLDAEGLGLILGNAAKVTRWIASVNTQYNPVFGAYNFIRDVGGAQFNLTTTPIAGKQAAVTKNVFSALGGIYKDLRSERAGEGPAKGYWSDLWEEFQREGGATGYRDQFSKSKDELNIIEKNIRELEKGNIKKGVQAVFNWLSDYNDALENAVRLSAYKVALDQGLSKERAASIAKNLTVNFNRKGAWGQQAGALYAFFNASVQGSTRLYETLTGPQGKKIIAGGLLLGSVQAIALAMAGFDDNDPPEFVKERNIVIPLPNGKYIAIPMPLGLHVIPNIGRLTTEMVMNGGKGSAKKIGNLLGVMMDAFNPIGNSGLSMQTLAPTLLDPAAAIMENKDAFGRPIAKEDRATNPTPGYTRSRDTASFISKELSKFLNYASGGTKYQKGLVSPTADQLDYLIGQATGGVGREVLKAEQAVTSLATGEELPSYKVPLVGKFYGDVGSQASQANKFYDNITNMANHENEVKGRIKNREDVNSYYRDHPEARLYTQANTAENEITKINKEKKDAIERNSPPAVIKRIEDRKTAIMKRFNDRVSKAER